MNDEKQIVYIIDDDEDVRDSLDELIQSIGVKTKTYESAIDFIEEFDLEIPGCILADVRMPRMSGIELQHKLIEMKANQPLIIITGHGDITMAVQAMKDGAFEFLQKPFRDQALLDCVSKALDVESTQRRLLLEKKFKQDLIQTLSEREREVIDLVLEGKANKVIARELNISDRTVEIHRSHAMKKLEVKSVAELVKMMLASQD